NELLTIVPILKRFGVPLIAMTGRPHSTLAREADIHLDVGVEKEACPLGLAPTSSTTVALVMGDALAVALLDSRGFTETDFALSHPGGSLGRRLLLHVADIMHTGDTIPKVSEQASLRDALLEMTKKNLGMTAIIDANNTVLGIYTDGDLRRTLDKNIDIHQARIADVMTRNCKTARAGLLAAEVLKIMQDNKINAMLAVDENNKLVGALNMHDLLRAGVV
ncbi:MAG: arabinose-5-phosphate isomerase, partial [Pseudomonadota bacterium]|nr:arabinose-5-phosphate isomerase [Pseudomonadota bacterium]